jgi:hypothetical protein
LFLTIGFNNSVLSQYNADFGISLGASGYLGDIGGKEFESKGFIGDLILKQTNISAGIFFRYKLNPRIAINTSLDYSRIGADDLNSGAGPRYWRNLRFINDIIEISPKCEFILFQISDLGGSGRYRTSMNIFAHAGLSFFYHMPRGSKNGYTWVKLRPLETEGNSYKKIAFATPFGGGINITHNRYTRFGLVLNYRQTFTDYLDDISTVFVDPSYLSADAAELANQYIGPEEDQVSFMPGEKRGNHTNNDVFFTVCLTYSKYLMGGNKYKPYRRNTRNRYRAKSFQRSKSRVLRTKF